MKKGQIVAVEWEDACSSNAYWDDRDKEFFAPVPTETVGHFIEKDKRAVYLCTEVFRKGRDADDHRHIHTIPRKMIKRIRTLEG